jgi:putative Mg2+ transporter-C (MgtC) family protein
MASLDALDIVVRLLVAAAAGAVIGAERDLGGQDAGLRTHLMLALGAGVFGVVSVGAWDDFHDQRGDTNFAVDVTRVASYVAAGVGFLGGGVILKHAGSVRGLTTAGGLWVAAAAGLAAGVGMWVATAAATGVALLSLAALRPLSRMLQRGASKRPGRAVIVLAPGADAGDVVRAVRGLPLAAERLELGGGEDAGGLELVADFATDDGSVLAACLAEISGRDDVVEVRAARA